MNQLYLVPTNKVASNFAGSKTTENDSISVKDQVTLMKAIDLFGPWATDKTLPSVSDFDKMEITSQLLSIACRIFNYMKNNNSIKNRKELFSSDDRTALIKAAEYIADYISEYDSKMSAEVMKLIYGVDLYEVRNSLISLIYKSWRVF